MSAPDDPLVGQIVDGRYRIDGVLGRGGMGAVYRAHQLGIERDVAFKVLRSDKRQSAALQRFEAEARIIARLRHPHTVRLIDFGRLEDDLYLVLELIGGHPLSTLIASESVAPALALELCAQIADALTEAHGLGIVHRDLKPANILVEPIGDREVARILDFGVARAADNTMTRDGAVMGTPAYMAPEQAQGLPAEATADIYALGVILFEALSGSRPFSADTHFALMMMHISTPAPALTPRLPRGEAWNAVGLLVDQMLAKDPAERPSTAGEVRDRLRALHARLVQKSGAGAWPTDSKPAPMTLMADDSGDDLMPLSSSAVEAALHPPAVRETHASRDWTGDDRSAPSAAPRAGSSSGSQRPSGALERAPASGQSTRWYQPGERIGDRYAVQSLLGHGGFAAVYAAHDPVVDRVVAVKVLDEGLDGPDRDAANRAAERFRREARSAAMIVHPNVVTIYDLGIGERHARPFIVMELLDGRDLGEELGQTGPMPPGRAFPLLYGALLGLAAGHELGIVHKDLKPSNLFVVSPGTADEKLCLFDFGIARLDAGEKGSTASGEMFGTAQYLAPEYVSEGRVSPALDVYQMGLILVEMLTGQKVVDTDVAITAAVTHGSGSLRIPVDLLRGPFGWVLRRALAHDPSRRFSDAQAFAAALATVDPDTVPVPATDDVALLKNAPPPDIPDPFEGVEPGDFADAMTGLHRIVTVRRRRRWMSIMLTALVALGGLGALLALAMYAPEPDRGTANAGNAGSASTARVAQAREPEATAGGTTSSTMVSADATSFDATPPDAAPPDATPPDAAPPDAIPDADEQTERATLTAALEADLQRCRCQRAKQRLRALERAGGDGQGIYDAACAPQRNGRGPGACGRALLRRLDRAMSACPCAGDENKRLVETLARQFSVDRRQAWSRRCVVPGLPRSCGGRSEGAP